jgi:aspartate carbamoyltransferase catalytic subunit
MPQLKNIIYAQDFDRATLELIFEEAKMMEYRLKRNDKSLRNILEDKTMAVLFYEPSTRTRLSFEMAMINLGGRVIGTENAGQFSSKAKGESLEDTIKVITGYHGVNVVVLRYNKEGGAERAQTFSTVPVINAGDGPGQHPTQAFLDLYTIWKKFGRIDNLNITMLGDLLNSRTVRSLCYCLAKMGLNNRVNFVSPKETRMRDDIKEYLDKYEVKWSEHDHFCDIIEQCDVFYQTRVQKERFQDEPILYETVSEAAKNLIITPEVVQRMKKEAIIMHPLPRVNEISYAVDKDPRAFYFEQSKNGLYVRMAILKLLLCD